MKNDNPARGAKHRKGRATTRKKHPTVTREMIQGDPLLDLMDIATYCRSQKVRLAGERSSLGGKQAKQRNRKRKNQKLARRANRK